MTLAQEQIKIGTNELKIIKHFPNHYYSITKKRIKKERTFDVKMRCFDDSEICELIGIYLLRYLIRIIDKNDTDLYRDNRLIILRTYNRQK